MSATTNSVALFTESKFWVFDTRERTLIMSGVCDKRQLYVFCAGDGEIEPQCPVIEEFATSSFSSVALSDEFLAIVTKKKIMVFAIRGQHSGRLLVSDKIPKAAITKLCFSNDGTQLVALVVIKTLETYEQAHIYRTETFRPDANVPRPDVLKSQDISPALVKWNHDLLHSPLGIAFSKKGTLIAIWTTHCQGHAEIRILKKEVEVWRSWGICAVTVHLQDHREWHGVGVTGISLYPLHPCALNIVFKMTNVWLYR